MKKTRNNRLFSAVAWMLIVVLAYSCNDKVQLIGDGEERAIVYSVLDPSETTHYVKITRSFIGNGTSNSIDIAKISDSSYFKKVDAKIEEILPNDQLGRTFVLHDTLIKNKETDGVFYAPDQKMYVFYTPEDQPLLENARYRLSITIDDGRIQISGETHIVSGIVLGSWTGQNIAFKLTRSGSELGQYASQAININNIGNAYRMHAKVRFDYREFSASSSEFTDKHVWFDLGESAVTPGFVASHTFLFPGETFYARLQQQISPKDATVDRRVHKGFEIQIIGGSNELANYMDVNRPSSSLAQNKPKYTNMTITPGYEVVGIFASRNTKTIYKPASTIQALAQALDKKSRRELCLGPATQQLGFCSELPNDASDPWACP